VLTEECESAFNMAVFRDILPCSLVDINRRFRQAYSFHHQGTAWLSVGATLSPPWLLHGGSGTALLSLFY
jgi:hypothetical protein